MGWADKEHKYSRQEVTIGAGKYEVREHNGEVEVVMVGAAGCHPVKNVEQRQQVLSKVV